MPHPPSVECLIQIYEYAIKALLVLLISLAQNPGVKDLLRCTASCPKPSLLFSYDCFGLGFQPVQYYSEHHLTETTDQVDGTIVVTLL